MRNIILLQPINKGTCKGASGEVVQGPIILQYSQLKGLMT